MLIGDNYSHGGDSGRITLLRWISAPNDQGSEDLIGPLFGILSAISFALSNAATRRAVQTIPASFGIHITIFIGIPLLVLAAAATGQLFDVSHLSNRAYLLLAAAGLNQFLLGRYTLYRSFAAIGANRSTPITSLSLPLTLFLAMLVLGERISIINGVGIAIVVLAPVIMLEREPKLGEVDPSRLWEGYFFALINALASGITPVLIRESIGGTGLGIVGGLVSYTAAALPLLFWLAWPGNLTKVTQIDKTALHWFVLTSFALFIAHMFRFAAFDVATLTVVTPLMRAGALFTVFFAYLINRQTESFGRKTLVAIGLSVVGSVFVVL